MSMRTLNLRALFCELTDQPISQHIIDDMVQMSADLEDDNTPAHVKYLKVKSELAQSNYYVALIECEKNIALDPMNMDLHFMLNRLKDQLYYSYIVLAWAKPLSPEIAIYYDKLLHYGHTAPEGQLLAASHYYEIGQIDKAKELIQLLYQVSPHYLFTKDLYEKINNIQNQTDTVGKTTSHHFHPHDLIKMKDQYAALRIYAEAGNFEALLKQSSTMIADKPLQNDNLFLYQHKAIALDMLGKHGEALEIMVQVMTICPLNLTYQKTFQTILKRMIDQAHARIDAPAKEFMPYFHILRNYWFCPYLIYFKGAEHYYELGQKQFAVQMVKNMTALSPHDSDYLALAIKFYSKFKETELLQQSLQELKRIRALRPYDLTLHEGILAEHE